MNDHPENLILLQNLERLKVPSDTMTLLMDWQCENIDVGVLADGSPSLRVNGKPVYPEANALQIVARQSSQLVQGNDPELIVFFGLGLGLHLEFLRRFSKAPIIVFDPDFHSLAGVLKHIPLNLEDVVLVTDISRLGDVMMAHLGRATSKIQVGALPTWIQDHNSAFEAFRDAIQKVMLLMEVDRTTRDEFEDEWISHTATNLPFIGNRKSWDVLGQQFAGKPAVLVGAGPSLDKNLDVLARVQNNVLIVATHSAVIPLAKAGIASDLVVIIENHQLDYYFENVENLEDMVLIASPQTHPVHLGLGFGGFLGISQEGNVAANWVHKAFGEMPLRSGGSVACAAFSVMHGLGCDPLVFVGMDLAYSENRSHAGDSCEGCCKFELDRDKGVMMKTCQEDKHASTEVPFEPVPGWGGNQGVNAHPVYSMFRHWFETAARSWVGQRQLINATEGGARIEGFREMTMLEVAAEFCTESFPAKSMIKLALDNAVNQDPALLAVVVKDELSIVENAARVAKDADKIAQKALKLLRSGQLGKVQPSLDQLQAHERRLQELTRGTMLLNSKVGLKIQQLAAEKIQGDQVATTIHSLEQSRKISKLIINGAGELLELFKPALQKMEAGA